MNERRRMGERGWLKTVLDAATNDVNSLPEWMRHSAEDHAAAHKQTYRASEHSRLEKQESRSDSKTNAKSTGARGR